MPSFLPASTLNQDWRSAIVILGLVAAGTTVIGLVVNYVIVANLRPASERRVYPALVVRRYSRQAILLHWFYSAAFIILLVTGIILFASGRTASASPVLTVHIAAGVAAIAVPLAYLVFNPVAAIKGIGNALTWDRKDLEWLRAAPMYYFLLDEGAMPPQGYLNTFQKMWLLVTLVAGFALAVSGILLWGWSETGPAGLVDFMFFVHDMAFITAGTAFIVHIYLTVVHPAAHPLNVGSWSAMTRGTVSEDYARTHHALWYADITRDKNGKR